MVEDQRLSGSMSAIRAAESWGGAVAAEEGAEVVRDDDRCNLCDSSYFRFLNRRRS